MLETAVSHRVGEADARRKRQIGAETVGRLQARPARRSTSEPCARRGSRRFHRRAPRAAPPDATTVPPITMPDSFEFAAPGCETSSTAWTLTAARRQTVAVTTASWHETAPRSASPRREAGSSMRPRIGTAQIDRAGCAPGWKGETGASPRAVQSSDET